MEKLLLRKGDKSYRFLQHEFRFRADGSLYVVFDRISSGLDQQVWNSEDADLVETMESSKEKFRVSYHPSGCVVFHGGNSPPIYNEPLYALTKRHMLFAISLPRIDCLTEIFQEYIEPQAIRVPDDQSGEVGFVFEVAPATERFESPPLVVICYNRLFSLIISLCSAESISPISVDERVIKAVPTKGSFNTQVVTEAEAMARMHQSINGNPGIPVLYWSNGVYRMVMSTPMRIVPSAHIEFEDPNLRAEMIEPVKHVTQTVDVRFYAVGRGGRLKTPQSIKRAEFSAEL